MPRTTARRSATAEIEDYEYRGTRPRSYQVGMRDALAPRIEGGRLTGPAIPRVFCSWHRRSRKTGGVIGLVFVPWMILKPGQYIHILPDGVQARRVVWQNEDFQALFPSLGEGTTTRNDTEMVVTMRVPRWVVQTPEGPVKIHDGGISRYYLVGADDRKSIDKIRGMNPRGLAIDECGWTDLMALLRVSEPALKVNRGWLWMGTTPPEVYNEAVHREYLRMQEAPGCYVSTVRATDSRADAEGEDGSPIVTADDIAAYAAVHGHSAAAREFMCSWDAADVSGSIYGDWMREARDKGHVGQYPHAPGQPVGVFTDIGSDNLTTILFYQQHAGEIWFIDYHASAGSSPEKTAGVIMSKPYRYGRMVLPHDAGHHRYESSNISVEDQLRSRLSFEIVVGNKVDNRWTGIYRVREMFPRFRFHEPALGVKPADGIPSFLESMEKYAEKVDGGRRTGQVLHPFSDGPDALRTGIQEWREGMSAWDDRAIRQERTIRNYNVLEGRGNRDQSAAMPRWAA